MTTFINFYNNRIIGKFYLLRSINIDLHFDFLGIELLDQFLDE